MRERRTELGRIGGAVVITAALLATLTACAPEPAAEMPGKSATATPGGTPTKGSGTAAKPSSTPQPSGGAPAESEIPGKPGVGSGGDGASWPEQDNPEELPKQSSVPASFPGDRFLIPAGSVIDDAGERSGNEWFVVIRAPDQAAADALWASIISSSGLAVWEEAPATGSGVSAELGSASLEVSALTLPQPDGSVLLSYDITATA